MSGVVQKSQSDDDEIEQIVLSPQQMTDFRILEAEMRAAQAETRLAQRNIDVARFQMKDQERVLLERFAESARVFSEAKRLYGEHRAQIETIYGIELNKYAVETDTGVLTPLEE